MNEKTALELSRIASNSGVTCDELSNVLNDMTRRMPPIQDSYLLHIETNPNLNWFVKWKIKRKVKNALRKQKE